MHDFCFVSYIVLNFTDSVFALYKNVTKLKKKVNKFNFNTKTFAQMSKEMILKPRLSILIMQFHTILNYDS